MEGLELGFYEELITKLISNQLNLLDQNIFYIKSSELDKMEASRHLSLFLFKIIKYSLNEIPENERPIKQIELSNKIIQLLVSELPGIDIEQNLLETEGRLLEAVISKIDYGFGNINARIKEVIPLTRFSQSELFTGNNGGISLESELKKEILTSDEICWLVSFIKFSGIRIFKDQLEEFTENGKRLRIITTTYMGATDAKAIEFLSSLKNTEIKVSYNSDHERLHAKAYLFLRKSGFDTGYIGSSNISRSALTNGLEWNLKVTSKEINHIIDKFKKTFETYWVDKDFDRYQQKEDYQKLRNAINDQKSVDSTIRANFFDLKPYSFQQEILEKLEAERNIQGRFKNLIVAATGTGKTIISSFDYQNYKNNNSRARLLYVAHRKEILEQARNTFQNILKDSNFGELWVDGIEPSNFNYVFASIQTINKRIEEINLSNEFYDYIIIDEVHHITAGSYRTILSKFSPKILLGLTATPERMDGENILSDFCGVIAAEIRLPEALNRKLLTPFQYFALSDSVDLSKIPWKNGKYEINELRKIYTENDRRVSEIILNCNKYLTEISSVKALGFCVNVEHAKYMAEKFTIAGLKSDYLTSENSNRRNELKENLRNGTINYLFLRDIFNEGVDIPEIDTVLFLRPTESLTIFLQQLGRGLRLSKGKDCLTVLDFVGNSRPEYDFENKFRALNGKTHNSILKEIEHDFPNLPLGCSIILEKKAKEIIIKNIKEATINNKSQLISKIQNFNHRSILPLNLKNFLDFYQLEPQIIFKYGGWNRLCVDAGLIENFNEPNEIEIKGFIKRILNCNSIFYLTFILNVFKGNFNFDSISLEENLMLLMIHYDIWQVDGNKLLFKNLIQSFNLISINPKMVSETIIVIEYLISKVDFIEKKLPLQFPLPLRLHSRYNRNQILVATGLTTFEKKSSNREGVASNQELNIESFFITLKKTEKDYSPSTLYDDYAINESLFHIQTQNSTSPESKKGKSFINHKSYGKKIFIFVREQNSDDFGFTLSYIFLGEATFVKSEGSKPMNIEWRLKVPMPAYLWKESGKLAVG